MKLNEATKVIRENLNLNTDFAIFNNEAVKFIINDPIDQRFYLSKKHCLEVAQAFMVLAANMNNK